MGSRNGITKKKSEQFVLKFPARVERALLDAALGAVVEEAGDDVGVAEARAVRVHQVTRLNY